MESTQRKSYLAIKKELLDKGMKPKLAQRLALKRWTAQKFAAVSRVS